MGLTVVLSPAFSIGLWKVDEHLRVLAAPASAA
jgi:hypothetical protein